MELAHGTVFSQTTEGSLSSPAPTHLTNAFGIRLDGVSRFLKKAGIESTSYRSIPSQPPRGRFIQHKFGPKFCEYFHLDESVVTEIQDQLRSQGVVLAMEDTGGGQRCGTCKGVGHRAGRCPQRKTIERRARPGRKRG